MCIRDSFKITVPQLRPIIVYAFLMGLINAFKVYNEVFSLCLLYTSRCV